MIWISVLLVLCGVACGSHPITPSVWKCVQQRREVDLYIAKGGTVPTITTLSSGEKVYLGQNGSGVYIEHYSGPKCVN